MSRLAALVLSSLGMRTLAAVGAGHFGVNFGGLVRGLQRLLPVLDTPVRALPPQPVLRYADEAEPDLVALVVRPLQARLSAALGGFADTARTEVQATLGGIVGMLDHAAVAFDKAGDQAARLGLGKTFERIAGSADAMAAAAFPVERREPSGLAALGQGFGLAVSGAFRAMEGVLGGYLGFVLGEWRAHLDANADTPVEVTATSPRILLEKARLGRVHMDRMRLVLAGVPTTPEAAERVAARFAAAVREAHAAGEARLGTWRLASQPVPVRVPGPAR